MPTLKKILPLIHLSNQPLIPQPTSQVTACPASLETLTTARPQISAHQTHQDATHSTKHSIGEAHVNLKRLASGPTRLLASTTLTPLLVDSVIQAQIHLKFHLVTLATSPLRTLLNKDSKSSSLETMSLASLSAMTCLLT